MEYLLLILGFIALVKGADFFVDGAKEIAAFLKIPSVIVGLTIVSIGTSLPEASVSITAGLAGSNEIALGNVLGSNIFNVAMVLGCCALIKPIHSHKQIMTKDMPFMFIISLVTLGLMFDGQISRIDAFILLALFIFFICYLVVIGMKSKSEDEGPSKTLPVAILYSIGGVALIILGGDFVVNSAQTIATTFGISEEIIGLTVVAIGTSLPELVTSVVAAKKGESDIALGNVVGSNIFNLLFILGSSTALTPIAVTANSVYDLGVFIALSVFTYLALAKSKELKKFPAAILVVCYIVYNVYIVMR